MMSSSTTVKKSSGGKDGEITPEEVGDTTKSLLDANGVKPDLEDKDKEDITNVVSDFLKPKVKGAGPDLSKTVRGAVDERALLSGDDSTGGDNDKLEAGLKRYAESQESLERELSGHFEEGEEIEEIESLFQPEDLISQDEEDEAQEIATDYIDEDFCSVPDEIRQDAVNIVIDHIDDEEEDIREFLLSQYEISDDEASDIIIEAYRRYIDDVIDTDGDEVDIAFEDALDECPDECPLDYLADEFEIPEEAAAEMIRESKTIPNAVLAFADYVRRTLR